MLLIYFSTVLFFDVHGFDFLLYVRHISVQLLEKEISQLSHLHNQASEKANMDEYPFMRDSSKLTLSVDLMLSCLSLILDNICGPSLFQHEIFFPFVPVSLLHLFVP